MRIAPDIAIGVDLDPHQMRSSTSTDAVLIQEIAGMSMNSYGATITITVDN